MAVHGVDGADAVRGGPVFPDAPGTAAGRRDSRRSAGPSLTLVVHVDEPHRRVDVLLWHGTAYGDRGQVGLFRKNDVLENLRFPPKTMGFGIGAVEGAVD